MLITMAENTLRVKEESMTEFERKYMNEEVLTEDEYIVVRRFSGFIYIEGKPKHLYKLLFKITKHCDIELI